MRRYIRKRYLDTADDLNRIMEQAERAVKECIQADFEGVFSKIQQNLINMGTEIEAENGEGSETVHYLENICELLYMFLMENGTEQRLNCISDIKKATGGFISAVNDMKTGKKIVVFLPYKASMWDSLESIWRAACEDEDCTAYVVPVPYYDRNSDGSLGEMHYEGGEFPEYVPVTDLKQINLDELHPDIIYFHNPYDDSNRITCLEPSFFSKELRKKTELLVYVPYFVATGDRIQTHLCTLPGVIYSDITIVQSEAVRKVYIEELEKLERENNCVGIFGNLSEKILALGSPKYDKVKSACRKDYELPKEWENRLHNRKAVMYNTSIAAFMKYEKMMLETIRESIEMFAGDEDTVLLWRPHPLLKSTIEADYPELAEEYSDIVEAFKKSEKDIYDDSPDLYRAITWSDAYYGDMSSVVELFRRAGKNTIIQKPDRHTAGKYDNHVIFECAAEHDGGMYAADMEKNALYFIRENGEAEYICMFPGYSWYRRRLFSDIKTYNGRLVFIPYNAEEVYIYDIEKKEFDRIKPEAEYIQTVYEKFACGYMDGEYLWLIPAKSKSAVRISMESRKCEYIPIPSDMGNYFIKKGIAADGNLILMPSVTGKCFFELDTDALTVKKRQPDIEGEGIWSISCSGDVYRMMSYPDGSILAYEKNTGKICALKEYPEDISLNGFGYAMSRMINGTFYAFPVKADKAVMVKDGRICEAGIEEFNQKGTVTSYLTTLKDKLIFYRYDASDNDRLSGEYLIFDTLTMTSELKTYIISNYDRQRRDKAATENKVYYKALKKSLLEDKNITAELNEEQSCGELIYRVTGDMV